MWQNRKHVAGNSSTSQSIHTNGAVERVRAIFSVFPTLNVDLDLGKRARCGGRRWKGLVGLVVDAEVKLWEEDRDAPWIIFGPRSRLNLILFNIPANNCIPATWLLLKDLLSFLRKLID